jgi:hypothetical protein
MDLLRGVDLQRAWTLEEEMFPSRESNGTCFSEFGTTFLMSQAIRFIQCPAPFLKNTKADLASLAANEGVHSKFCIMPCPSFVYSDAGNKIMWFSYVAPGTIALVVNFVATVSLLRRCSWLQIRENGNKLWM